MRAVKRERYAVKELKQLKSILQKVENKDADITEMCTVLPEGTLSKGLSSKKNETNEDALQSNSMEVDGGSRYHPVRLTNEHGNYPIWMNQRAIKKHKAKLIKMGHVQKKGKKNKRKA